MFTQALFHQAPEFGKMLLIDLKTDHIQRLINKMYENGLIMFKIFVSFF